jgi:acetyltransferase
VAKLEKVLGVGSLISNPIDGGFGVLQSAETYRACIDAMQEDPNIDMVLLQEAIPREPGSARGEAYIKLVDAYVAAGAKKPISFVTLTSHGQTEHSRALRHEVPHVSFLQEANKALRAIESAARRSEADVLAKGASSVPPLGSLPVIAQQILGQAKAQGGTFALDEVRSKALLAAYGIPLAREELAGSADEAVAAAERIGFPVVLKAVSATLLHKSDVGAVALNLADAAAVRTAWTRIDANLTKHGFTGHLEGMLLSEMVKGGLELVLGLHRDPEMGLIAMAGTGGVLLELIKDVAFCVPPITREKALDLIGRTHVAKLAAGYRGSAKLDMDALAGALCGLGKLALDLAEVIESVDVNPFLLRESGAVALDALVVLRGTAG